MISQKQVTDLREFFYNNEHCVLEKSFSIDLINFLKLSSQFTSLKGEQEPNDKKDIVQASNKKSIAQYSSIIGESLLVYLTNIYSQISNKNLYPTYSFFRTYYQGGTLLPHTDRPSCQYSATIQLDRSDNLNWPIYLKNKNYKKFECSVGLGDVVFYKGQELLHWREPLQYKYSSHLFLHWIDYDDPQYKIYKFDRRKKLGDSPWIPPS